MSDTPDDSVPSAPPVTGHAALDDALNTVAGIDDRPLAEQLSELTSAHERVNAALAAAQRRPGSPGESIGHRSPGQ